MVPQLGIAFGWVEKSLWLDWRTSSSKSSKQSSVEDSGARGRCGECGSGEVNPARAEELAREVASNI
jgi:hypothetical protein